MKKLVSIAVLSFFVISGAALAQQSGDQEEGSSMHGMMGQMMQGQKSGEGGMGDMKGMMKMMGPDVQNDGSMRLDDGVRASERREERGKPTQVIRDKSVGDDEWDDERHGYDGLGSF